MPVRDEDNTVMRIYDGGRPWEDSEDTVSEWKKVFVLVPKKSDLGTKIIPFTFAYTRTRGIFRNGQSLNFTDWLTPAEYIMSLLKRED